MRLRAVNSWTLRAQNATIHRTLWPPQPEPEPGLEDVVTSDGEPLTHDGELVTNG